MEETRSGREAGMEMIGEFEREFQSALSLYSNNDLLCHFREVSLVFRAIWSSVIIWGINDIRNLMQNLTSIVTDIIVAEKTSYDIVVSHPCNYMQLFLLSSINRGDRNRDDRDRNRDRDRDSTRDRGSNRYLKFIKLLYFNMSIC